MGHVQRRDAAQELVQRWKSLGYEKGDTHKFWLDLSTNVLGINDATTKVIFEQSTVLRGYIDAIVVDAKTFIEQKSLGVDLDKPEVRQDEPVTPYVDAAHDAFTTGPWSKTTPSERAELMLRIADEIEKRATELSLTNTLENGSPVAETSGAAANAASIFRYFATLAPELEADDVRPFPNGQGESLVRKDPIGVCALIAPWNFPINLMVTKLAPALLAGCTVVMKPASPTPLSFRIIVDAVAAAGVPAGVVNYVTGPGRMGDLMVRHPKVAKVAFTGSTPVGRHIAAACGELLRPVTLELGGKSSAIVMEDADLHEMSARLIRSCMRNTGQTCYISTRILAPASRYDEIVNMVTETIATAPQGDPLEPATVFGPSANHSQYKSVLAHLDSAKAEGARVTTGGEPAPLGGELANGLSSSPPCWLTSFLKCVWPARRSSDRLLPS